MMSSRRVASCAPGIADAPRNCRTGIVPGCGGSSTGTALTCGRFPERFQCAGGVDCEVNLALVAELHACEAMNAAERALHCADTEIGSAVPAASCIPHGSHGAARGRVEPMLGADPIVRRFERKLTAHPACGCRSGNARSSLLCSRRFPGRHARPNADMRTLRPAARAVATRTPGAHDAAALRYLSAPCCPGRWSDRRCSAALEYRAASLLALRRARGEVKDA
jgi:hypothetical protein